MTILEEEEKFKILVQKILNEKYNFDCDMDGIEFFISAYREAEEQLYGKEREDSEQNE